MYKLQQNGVTKLGGGFIPENPLLVEWQEYTEWRQAGNIPEPEHTDQELLDLAKVVKSDELTTAYKKDKVKPVTQGGFTFANGEEMLDAVLRDKAMALAAGDLLVTVIDIDGIERLLSFATADLLLGKMATNFKSKRSKKLKADRDLTAAATIADVEKIKW